MLGIPFGTELVPSVMDGTKTMTRRVIMPQPKKCRDTEFSVCKGSTVNCDDVDPTTGDICPATLPKPRYKVGETYYVKETWALLDGKYIYKSDCTEENEYVLEDIKWRSPRFMPRAAASAYIKIVAVRPERVQEISDADVVAEGFKDSWGFVYYWDAMYKNDPIKGYDANPWVWAYTFELTEKPQ